MKVSNPGGRPLLFERTLTSLVQQLGEEVGRVQGFLTSLSLLCGWFWGRGVGGG